MVIFHAPDNGRQKYDQFQKAEHIFLEKLEGFISGVIKKLSKTSADPVIIARTGGKIMCNIALMEKRSMPEEFFVDDKSAGETV